MFNCVVTANAPVEKQENTPHLTFYTEKGKEYFLLEGKNYWTIGRGRESDIMLKDEWISRNHAMIQCTETGGFYLIDLGSRNGTFVNGRRVGIPVTLHNEDQITFGKISMEFYCPSADRQTLGLDDPDRATSVLRRRQLTSVMVVDMRNFTVLTRQLEEEVLSQLIGDWFHRAGQIIRQSGSWVDKYIGDAVMAIWFHGAEEVNPREIIKIFQAVSNLNRMTQDLSYKYDTDKNPLPFPLRIGAGINTGYAMVANTGSGDHPDYTAIGDTVNAAFRLESATKEIGFDLAIGETTYSYLSQLKQAQQVFQENTVNLKGYDTPTVTYGIKFEDLDRFLSTIS